MYRLFVFLLIGSLAMPAVPVSGCECSHHESGQNQACCCSKVSAKQTPEQKSCCCPAAQPKQKQAAPSQPQCQQTECDCHQVYSHSATPTSVKSVELARQLQDNLESINLTDEPCSSVRPAVIHSLDLPPPVLAQDSGELCAHICLWLI